MCRHGNTSLCCLRRRRRAGGWSVVRKRLERGQARWWRGESGLTYSGMLPLPFPFPLGLGWRQVKPWHVQPSVTAGVLGLGAARARGSKRRMRVDRRILGRDVANWMRVLISGGVWYVRQCREESCGRRRLLIQRRVAQHAKIHMISTSSFKNMVAGPSRGMMVVHARKDGARTEQPEVYCRLGSMISKLIPHRVSSLPDRAC